MRKVQLLQILFVIAMILGAIVLTAAVFADRNPKALSVSARIIGVGLVGDAVCAIVKANQELKKK